MARDRTTLHMLQLIPLNMLLLPMLTSMDLTELIMLLLTSLRMETVMTVQNPP